MEWSKWEAYFHIMRYEGDRHQGMARCRRWPCSGCAQKASVTTGWSLPAAAFHSDWFAGFGRVGSPGPLLSSGNIGQDAGAIPALLATVATCILELTGG